MDELARIAEILRPLWPGVVMRVVGRRLVGSTGRVHINVFSSDTLDEKRIWTCTVGTSGEQYRATWKTPEEAERQLTVQRDHIRGIAKNLLSALGLEVSDG